MLWGGIFDVDNRLQQIAQEEQLTHAPDFWDDPKRAEQILKNVNLKKEWTNLNAF